MKISMLIGTVAAIFTTSALLPQVIKAHQMKETRDLSLAMYLMTAMGVTLWIIYGLMIIELPVIVANVATLTLILYILYLKRKYG